MHEFELGMRFSFVSARLFFNLGRVTVVVQCAAPSVGSVYRYILPSRGLYNGREVNFVFFCFFFVFWVSHVFSFFSWYFPFILVDFPVNSDVFFTFVLFFLSVPCVSYFFWFLFLSFCYILCHYQCFCVLFSLFFGYFPSCSCFLVISNVFLAFSWPSICLYVFSIFGIYTLILLGLLLSCPRFFRCVFPFFHYYLFLRFFVFAGTVLCFS